MNCQLKEFKLAWLDGPTMHSAMFDTEQEARQAESVILGPSMIMKLKSHDGVNYSWVMLSGPWTWIVKNYVLIAILVTALVAFLAYKYAK